MLVTIDEVPVTIVDESWCDELAARIDDIRAGRVELEDVDEGDAKILARLAAKQVGR